MKSIFILVISGTFLFFGCKQISQQESDLSELLRKGKWIDLTYPFSEQTLYWPASTTSFKLDTVFNGMAEGGYFYCANNFSAPEHGGTHVDAPAHFAKGKNSVDEIPFDHLNGTAVVIDVSTKVKSNPDYLIGRGDLDAWEKENGQIPDGDIIIFRTGYGKYYPDAKKYFGTDQRGQAAVALLHFPGIDPEAARWLVKDRNISAVGLDTPSIDYGQSKTFETHRILLGENIPAFENLANLDQLPATGVYIFAMPMKIKGGSGAPLRIMAWVRKK